MNKSLEFVDFNPTFKYVFVTRDTIQWRIKVLTCSIKRVYVRGDVHNLCIYVVCVFTKYTVCVLSQTI